MKARMRQIAPSWAMGYGTAFVVVLIVTAIRIALSSDGNETLFLLYPLCIAMIAGLSGAMPGAGLSTVMGYFLFVDRSDPSITSTISTSTPPLAVWLVLFILEGIVISTLIGIWSRRGDRSTDRLLHSPAAGDASTRNSVENDAASDVWQLVEGLTNYSIILLDDEGRMTTWPPSAQRMLGYAPDEIVGQSFAVICPTEDHFRREASGTAETSSSEREIPCVGKNGATIWVAIAHSVLRDSHGKLRGYAAVLRDTTERRQAEETHRQRADQLAAANRLKDEFLATVSHELRTPLNSILGWAQLLRGGRLDQEGQIHALETIEKSAKQQARLIEDLLDISRVITGKMQLDARSLDLRPVIEAAIETVRPAAEAKGVTLHHQFDSATASVFGDPSRLQQVLWNLLSNAIKFTPRNGSVTTRLEHHDSHVDMVVEDTGVGIEPGFLPHVFDAFRQADSSSTRSHKGLGLGLAIVRRLVELHGGTVRAESAGDNRGATFRVSLPVASVQSAKPKVSNPRTSEDKVFFPPALPGLRVVVVDDDPGGRELLATVLADAGADVTTAASAQEGLAAVQQVHPDVLLSDIEMPNEDGYAFIRKVRELAPDEGGQTPAIAVTAYARAEDRGRAMRAGFQVHLAKPVEPDALAAAIAKLAGTRKGKSDVEVIGHR